MLAGLIAFFPTLDSNGSSVLETGSGKTPQTMQDVQNVGFDKYDHQSVSILTHLFRGNENRVLICLCLPHQVFICDLIALSSKIQYSNSTAIGSHPKLDNMGSEQEAAREYERIVMEEAEEDILFRSTSGSINVSIGVPVRLAIRRVLKEAVGWSVVDLKCQVRVAGCKNDVGIVETGDGLLEAVSNQYFLAIEWN